jgi:hypothetical protein
MRQVQAVSAAAHDLVVHAMRCLDVSDCLLSAGREKFRLRDLGPARRYVKTHLDVLVYLPHSRRLHDVCLMSSAKRERPKEEKIFALRYVHLNAISE